MITDKLPDKPSAILRAALEDLRKIENNPISFEVELGDWVHLNTFSGKCEVCLAGAALIHTCEMGVREFDWLEIDADLNNKMDFLNCIAFGDVRGGLRYLMDREDIPEGIPKDFDVPNYSTIDRHQFRDALNNIAKIFEKEGI